MYFFTAQRDEFVSIFGKTVLLRFHSHFYMSTTSSRVVRRNTSPVCARKTTHRDGWSSSTFRRLPEKERNGVGVYRRAVQARSAFLWREAFKETENRLWFGSGSGGLGGEESLWNPEAIPLGRALHAPRLRTVRATLTVCLWLICFPRMPRALFSQSPLKSLSRATHTDLYHARIVFFARAARAAVAIRSRTCYATRVPYACSGFFLKFIFS